MSNQTDAGAEEGAHLEELPDGAGCVEIWSHLSEARERSARSRPSP